jgi:hypothetical protein
LKDCKDCSDYLCPSCFKRGVCMILAAKKCGGIECHICQGDILIVCGQCSQKMCEPCIKEDVGMWLELV